LFQLNKEPRRTRRKAQQQQQKPVVDLRNISAPKKSKLAGIALVDHILAQNSLPAEERLQTAAPNKLLSPPKSADEADSSPLRRSKRIANQEQPAKSKKKNAAAKKVAKTSKKRRAPTPLDISVQDWLEVSSGGEGLPAEVGGQVPEEEEVPSKKRKSFVDEVAQYFWNFNPAPPEPEPSQNQGSGNLISFFKLFLFVSVCKEAFCSRKF